MKLFLWTLIFSFISVKGNAQSNIHITEDDIYDFMNEAVFIDGKRNVIWDSVKTNYYNWSRYCYDKDSNKINSIDCVLNEFLEDTLKFLVDSADIVFFKQQLQNPVLKVWDDKKLSKKVKVNSKNTLLAMTYCLPLFSRDKKTVVIGNPGPHGYKLYHLNSKNSKWELIDWIQTGT